MMPIAKWILYTDHWRIVTNHSPLSFPVIPAPILVIPAGILITSDSIGTGAALHQNVCRIKSEHSPDFVGIHSRSTEWRLRSESDCALMNSILLEGCCCEM